MKTLFTRIIPFLWLSASLLTLSPSATAQHDHHHSDSVNERPALQLNNGLRWATDAPLRAGMLRIQEAFARMLPGFRNDTLGPADYRTLADELNAELRYLFENCKLPQDADAQLHLILARITDAAAALDETGRESQGMITLHRALADYPEYFDHPGWNEIE